MFFERVWESGIKSFLLLKFNILTRFILVFTRRSLFMSNKSFFYWKTDSYSDAYWFRYAARDTTLNMVKIF